MPIEASRLLEFELEENLFQMEINEIPIWERIRYPVFRNIQRQNGLGQPHTSNNVNKKDYIYSLSLLLKNIVVKNPYLAPKSDIIFFGGRRKKQDDGNCWDIYFDLIRQEITFDSVHFEKSSKIINSCSTPTTNVRYIDLIKYGSLLARQFDFGHPDLPTNIEDKLNKVSKKIDKQFCATVDVHYYAERSLHLRNTRIGAYHRLIESVNPKVVILLPGYGNETIIEACNYKEIPVVEFQHGVISEDHFGYSYPGDREKKYFADYLFTFGEFWKEQAEFPIPSNRVVPVGYPHLEHSVKKYENIEPQDQLLFISQGTIGTELSKFAVKTAQHPEMNHKIVYKLHPGEYNRWREDYPWLQDANFRVIDSDDPPLHRLFAESNSQVGVYSTAIFEGLNFNLDTYIYDCYNTKLIDSIIEQGDASRITTVEDLLAKIRENRAGPNSDLYFKENYKENIKKALKVLLD